MKCSKHNKFHPTITKLQPTPIHHFPKSSIKPKLSLHHTYDQLMSIVSSNEDVTNECNNDSPIPIPIQPCNTPTCQEEESIVSSVTPNVTMVIEEPIVEQKLEEEHIKDEIQIEQVYKTEDAVVKTTINPMFAKRVKLKDLVSSVVSNSRVRKYNQNNGWNT